MSDSTAIIKIDDRTCVFDSDLTFSAVRAQGSGGQNVNKVSSAIVLTFDFGNSSLSPYLKKALRNLKDRRITKNDTIIIKAQKSRNQAQNKTDALNRLETIIRKAMFRPKFRVPTRPTKGSQRRRLDNKTKKSLTKKLRQPVKY